MTTTHIRIDLDAKQLLDEIRFSGHSKMSYSDAIKYLVADHRELEKYKIALKDLKIPY